MERQYGAWSDQVHGREMAYYGIKYPLALFWVGALMVVWVVGTGPDGLRCSGGREVGVGNHAGVAVLDMVFEVT
jgi:hypothetical protein